MRVGRSLNYRQINNLIFIYFLLKTPLNLNRSEAGVFFRPFLSIVFMNGTNRKLVQNKKKTVGRYIFFK